MLVSFGGKAKPLFQAFNDAITSAICITSHLALTVKPVNSFGQFTKPIHTSSTLLRRYSLSTNSWDMAPEIIPNGDVSIR